jgi:DNA-binding response OmpR family regulator
MVLDDEADITTVMRRGLEANGFSVDVFNDSEEAVRAFVPGRYDMLILDIRMPKMNGFDVYRELRKSDEKVRVAFMTAFEISDEEFQKVFPTIDVKCFFKKPVMISDLVSRISHVLSTPA